jgi:hypothetical protein
MCHCLDPLVDRIHLPGGLSILADELKFPERCTGAAGSHLSRSFKEAFFRTKQLSSLFFYHTLLLLLSKSCRIHDQLPSSWTSLSLVEVSVLSSCFAHLCLAPSAVAGLSMALGLALSGHTVRVLEKARGLGTDPGGIRLTPNVTKILVQWGLADELRKRGSLVREGSHLWDCK